MHTKIDLLIPTLNPDNKKLNDVLRSAKGFDRIILNIDKDTTVQPEIDYASIMTPIEIVDFDKHYDSSDAVNKLVMESTADWVLLWADNDYFRQGNLQVVLAAVRDSNTDVDIIITGNAQGDCSGVDLNARLYPLELSLPQMLESNMIISPSFFRTKMLQEITPFVGEIAQDWILNARLVRKGYKFNKINIPIYYWSESGKGGVWDKQFKNYGYNMEKVRAEINRASYL